MHRREFVRVTATAAAAGAAAWGPATLTRVGPGSGAAAGLDAAWFHASRRYAATSFGRIAYVEHGSGEAALFLHGFPLNGFQWRGALERLAPYRRCIAPDFMGLGYTDVARGQSLEPAAQAAMLVALLDMLGVGQVDVVANDSGGAVAQLLLVQHPQRVRTLLLTNCDTEPDCPPPALLPVIEMARAGTFVDSWLAPWHADGDLARSADGIGGLCYSQSAHPTDEAIAYYLAPLVGSERGVAGANGYTLALEANALLGIEPQLRRSRVPARIVWGTADPIFAAASPAYLDDVLGGSRGVRRLPHAKLFFPEEYPDIIAEEARALWDV